MIYARYLVKKGLLKKRFALLLEIIIATILAIGILSVLLSSYFSSAKALILSENVEREILEYRYLQYRLRNLFSNLQPVNNTGNFFFTQSDASRMPGSSSVVFTYDNGSILGSESFSGIVLSQLYLDNNNQIILLTWPEKELWPSNGALPPVHYEVLMNQVEQMELLFFPEDQTETLPFEWQKIWPKTLKSNPGMVQLKLRRRGNERVYFFIIPGEMSVIRYS